VNNTPPARFAVITCALLCLLFVLLSAGAAADKSATYDEPLHVATGWLNLWRGDFRLSPDVPPLWEYWIALPLGQNALNFDSTPKDQSLDRRAIAALYQTPGADGIGAVRRARWMSIPLAAALALLVAIWAGQIAGGAAAVAAILVFVLDPNWLGHAPLAKNDVAFAFVYFAAAYAVWRVGRNGSTGAFVAVLILPALCLGTKLSGLLVLPVMALCLVARAALSEPWMKIAAREKKIAIAIAICAAATLVAYAGIWAQYRFRFDAGPAGEQLDMPAMVRDLRDAEVRSQWRTNQPTDSQLAAWSRGFSTRAMLWLQRKRLVPQAWAAGYIYTQSQAGERTAFLLGQTYAGGRFSYFPLAWLFKEPVAMILAAILAAVVLARRRAWTWQVAALLIPGGVYLLVALNANVNVGLRHLFPVFPFIEVAIGITAARIWHAGMPGKWLLGILAAALAAETLSAYPDFIAFFNIASGGERGGIALLGDSNLDWGQDLPALARWQREHPDEKLYLDYFGTGDPSAYGIRYVNVPGGYVYGPAPRFPTGPGIAAVSATKLQRLFVIDPMRDFATQFDHAQPIDVLGGSIYLFRYPP
jgi:hypothetical protein